MAVANDEDFGSLFDGMDFVVNPLSLDTEIPDHFSSGPSSVQNQGLDQIPATSGSASDNHQNVFLNDGYQSSVVEPHSIIDSIMVAYSTTDPRSSLTKSISHSRNLAETSKPGIRRKKRSMRIGYGRSPDDGHGKVFDGGLDSSASRADYDASSPADDDVVEERRLDHGQLQSNGTVKDTELDLAMPEKLLSRSVSMDHSVSKGIEISTSEEPSMGEALSADEKQGHAVASLHPAQEDTGVDGPQIPAIDKTFAEKDTEPSNPWELQNGPENSQEEPVYLENDQKRQLSSPDDRQETSGLSPTLDDGKARSLVDETDVLDLRIQVPVGTSFETSLQFIKDALATNTQKIQQRIAEISHGRKLAAQKRRQMAEMVAGSSARFKEVEDQLEAACESEDFEQAETLSEALTAAEKAQEVALENFRAAEIEYDAYAYRMQKVIEMQVVSDEHGAQILEQLGQNALDLTNRARNAAEEKVRKEMDALAIEEEGIMLKKKKLMLELKVVEESKCELSTAIESSIVDESQEQQLLLDEKKVLLEELDSLLDAVNAKQAQIAERDTKLDEIKAKIDKTVAGFEKDCMDLEAEYDKLSSTLESLERELEELDRKKSHVDSEALKAQNEERVLEMVSNTAKMEAHKVRTALQVRKTLFQRALGSKEKQQHLALEEKEHVETARSVRSQTASLRASLQELASIRVKLHQDNQSASHQISLIEKRVPEIEAEKKLAAAARNFKEAGRLASEAKALILEKEKLSGDFDEVSSQLQKLDKDVEDQMKLLSELEEKLLEEEKKSTMARCERLRLLAVATRDERDAAIEHEDFEEAESLHMEAEAADKEADELKKQHGLEGDIFSCSLSVSTDAVSVVVSGQEFHSSEEIAD